MTSSRVARRYARALLDVAERGNEERWGAELQKLASIIDSPEVMPLLTRPELTHQQRQEMMAKIAERLNLSFPLRSFAVVIARHGRIKEIAAISQAYQDLVDRRLGRMRATLTFATQPRDEDVQRVVAGLENIAGKKIIPTVRVDNALLGGVTAELGGKIYDGSLATRLAEAQKQLAG
jgi:F-type H+-transporting ATPase subunit delta